MDGQDTRDKVRQAYGQALKSLGADKKPSCCGSGPASIPGTDPITRDLYAAEHASKVPCAALAASFGCGNPTALTELKHGEVVLDLGSGGGIDVLLTAKRVGATGKAYGLDMTPEMLELARQNQKEAGATNVEFLLGEMESIPLPDASVDVVISNCVINLAADKGKVLKEAFRVLRQGGRFAVSDVVLRHPLPDIVSSSAELWAGCAAGALVDEDYRAKLQQAGFTDIGIETTRVYSDDDVREMFAASSHNAGHVDAIRTVAKGTVTSAFVRACKP